MNVSLLIEFCGDIATILALFTSHRIEDDILDSLVCKLVNGVFLHNLEFLLQTHNHDLGFWNQRNILVLCIENHSFCLFKIILIYFRFEQWFLGLDCFKTFNDIWRVKDIQRLFFALIDWKPFSAFWEINKSFCHSVELDFVDGFEPKSTLSFLKLDDDRLALSGIQVFELVFLYISVDPGGLNSVSETLWNDMLSHLNDEIRFVRHKLGILNVLCWKFHLHSVVLNVDLPQVSFFGWLSMDRVEHGKLCGL